jgi:hypothetical protein
MKVAEQKMFSELASESIYQLSHPPTKKASKVIIFPFCRFGHTRKETWFSPKSLFKWTKKVCSNSLESLFNCPGK